MRARDWVRVAAITIVAVAPPTTGSLAAQSLDRVEELARIGQVDEARTMLTQWWNAAREGASQRDLERGLWLRAKFTVDPDLAELDFQRLVVLYPSSPYAPPALFRLAQSAHAHGDGPGAARFVSTIARDYPTSSTRGESEVWLRGAGPPPPPVDAPRPPRPSAPATGTATAPPAARPPAPADEVLEWAVQFGAFTDEDRAFALHQELVTAGLTARLVRVVGSGFVHVRIGRFSNRADASAQLQQVTARGFTAAIVRDDRAEEVVRR